jgi:hypothetical protein
MACNEIRPIVKLRSTAGTPYTLVANYGESPSPTIVSLKTG